MDYSTDVYQICDPDTGEQLFPYASLMKANISRPSKIMDHPVEVGTDVSDHKIILQVGIELSIIIDAINRQDTYDDIADAFTDSTFLTVMTSAGVFENMVIEDMPHDESPDQYGQLALGLRLRETLIVVTQSQPLSAQDVANNTDQSTVKKGETSSSATPSTTGDSLLYGMFHH